MHEHQPSRRTNRRRFLVQSGWGLGGLAAGVPAFGRALGEEVPRARILLVTGVDYPGHLWRKTWPVLAEALGKDARLEVFTVEDPHFLDSRALDRYAAVVMHWQNWEQPGPDAVARENFRRYVAGGRGVAVVHFACGAWHGEWPEYGRIVGREWHGAGPGKSQHDPYGSFRVEIVAKEHPITSGLEDFETTDELYTCLVGEKEIEVLAEATSKVDGRRHPMAFVSRYGKGRCFHCPLGHDVAAFSVPAVQELVRRGVAWSAGLNPAAGSGAAAGR